eukprot:CAMPEP_0119421766 /NCGR_PEP_ID=MMETSP1335-20130426/26607_1 /TAXON_ID=259385 /ORGANISM="Chrysoculter rhomboideus, Strain RCC1486" /LENGTH=81 /DNA_ID=CAMNT_0007447187 /DNA_START=1032 /DNA_END=1274 /DNA_ORIENTATION=-
MTRLQFCPVGVKGGRLDNAPGGLRSVHVSGVAFGKNSGAPGWHTTIGIWATGRVAAGPGAAPSAAQIQRAKSSPHDSSYEN